MGRRHHGTLPPERDFLCPSKREKFEECPNPVPDRADGHRPLNRRHARHEVAALG